MSEINGLIIRLKSIDQLSFLLANEFDCLFSYNHAERDTWKVKDSEIAFFEFYNTMFERGSDLHFKPCAWEFIEN